MVIALLVMIGAGAGIGWLWWHQYNAIRSIALGRRNWLFAGSHSGGERAAAMYSILQTVCEAASGSAELARSAVRT